MTMTHDHIHINMKLYCIVLSFLKKFISIMLLKTMDSLIGIWDCGPIYNLVDDYASVEAEEYQEYQDPCYDPDI
jgi:hypothetical protein